MATTLKGLKVRIGADWSEARKAFADVERAVKPVADRLKAVGETLTTRVTLPLAALGVAAFASAARMDSLKRGLLAVTGSSAETERQLGRLKEVAKLPGLGLEEAVQGSIRLQAVGYSAEQSERLLRGFGNALATIGSGKAELDGVVLALSQMATSPKVLQEEINQIRERLPQFSAMMVDAFGTARSEDIQKLGISGRDFVARMLLELEKLPPMQGGIQNSWENLGDAAKGALTSIGNTIATMVMPYMEKLAGALERFSKWWDTLPEGTRRIIVTFAGLLAVLGPLLVALGSLAYLLPVLAAGWALLTGPIGLTVAALAAVGAAAYVVYQAWEPISKWFANLWDRLTISANKGATKIINAVGSVARFFDPSSTFGFDLTAALSQDSANAQARINQRGPVDVMGALKASAGSIVEVFTSAAGAVKGFGGALSGLGAGADKASRALAGLKRALPAGWFEDKRQISLKGLEGPLTGFANGEALAAPSALRELEWVPEKLEEINAGLQRARVATAEWGAAMNAVVYDGLASAVDGLANALGSAVAGFQSFGDAVKQVMKQVIAQVVAAIAKIVILKGLLTIFGGGTGTFAGIVRDVAAGSGITQGFGGGANLTAVPEVANMRAGGGAATMDVSFRSHLMSNGVLLQAVRQGLQEEIREGIGDGTL